MCVIQTVGMSGEAGEINHTSKVAIYLCWQCAANREFRLQFTLEKQTAPVASKCDFMQGSRAVTGHTWTSLPVSNFDVGQASPSHAKHFRHSPLKDEKAHSFISRHTIATFMILVEGTLHSYSTFDVSC